MLTACRQSIAVWLNTFVWTFRSRYVNGTTGAYVQTLGNDCHIPFITWPIQDECINIIQSCINTGQSLNIDKSRDMGATWLVLAVFDHEFLFSSERQFGVVSRKEELVDASGDISTLFEKLRYINSMLPPWMVPQLKTRHLLMRNVETGCTIAGESTNVDVGRGGRKTAYMVDEAAAVENGESIENSLSQTTACQIWVSTARGPSTQFHKRITNKRGKYFAMPWWRHPEKAQGAHQELDEYGRVKWTSAWYEARRLELSPKALAQEVDMDHGSSGDMFFSQADLQRHRHDHVRPPMMQGALLATDEFSESGLSDRVQELDYTAWRFVEGHGRSPLKLWMQLNDGRPTQAAQYCIGCDISNGAGGSNSVITIVDRLSERVVAKWWDAFTSPEDMAVMAAMLGVWFGGAGMVPLIVFESNGPGGVFGRKLVRMRYPLIYCQRKEGSRNAAKTDRYGWHNNRAKKELLLGVYREALSKDNIIQPCAESLDEAGDYIYDEGGALIPAKMREEAQGGRDLHGDHVIADALAVLGMEELRQRATPSIAPPPGSFAYEREMSQRRKRERADAWRS